METLNNIALYAMEAHTRTNHMYSGSLPYSYHIKATAEVGKRYLYLVEDTTIHDEIIAACYCHDIIEDARQSYNDVLNETKSTLVAEIVYAVTNEKGKNRSERANDKYYQRIREQEGAVFVKLCDRIANVTYSKLSNNLRMLKLYREENENFLKKIIKDNKYQDMVNELSILLMETEEF